MNQSKLMLDPTSELSPTKRARLTPLDSLEGKTVGLLDITKPRGDILLNFIEEKLKEKGVKVNRYAKPTFARVAPIDVKQEISAQCDAVIEALAD
jgi:hypothetical protein